MIGVYSLWRNLGLRQRFMIVIGLGAVVLMALVVLVIARYEEQAMERKLHQLSVNEMTSLHALIVNVMAKRPEDAENIGINVFNAWFDSRNIHYPGKVWSAWGPKVAAHMHEIEPERAPKLPADDIDREAMAKGQPVGRLVGDNYRYAMPIVLGVTEGAEAEVCFSCHGGMGMEKGEVIAVLSSSLAIEGERRQLMGVVLVLSLGGIAAALVAVFGIRWILGKVITRPLGTMIGAMRRLADGATEVEVRFTERKDEIGDMARALGVFKVHMIDGERLRASQDQERDEAARERREALQSMADEFDRTVTVKVAGVEQATAGIRSSAQSMASRSERSGSRSLDVGRAAQITTERSAAAAEATRQLAESVRQVAGQVGQSASIAQQAVDDVNATAGRMDDLARAVEAIGNVVDLINDIAGQTNLLALNATIEAARAGEAGKGFAVVANEVKNLANQTARATGDISAQVAAVQASTEEMRRSIGGVVGTIRSMDEIAAAVSLAVGRQESAAHEIAANIDEVAVQAETVSQSVIHLAKSSAQSCAGTVRVIWCAKALAQCVDELRIDAEQFLHSVSNADKGDTVELF